MIRILMIALAGAAGALSRYGLGTAAQRLFPAGFPGGTLVVNVIGCFLIGLLTSMSLDRFSLSLTSRLVLVVGFLGAFTTFSAFGYDTLNLLRNGTILRAMLNVVLSVGLGLLAVWAGLMTARLFGGGA